MTRPDRTRVLSVARWPVGGIRTYYLYNYPLLLASGYRFTFVGPDDDEFDRLGKELAGWEGVDFVVAPLRGRHCRLRRTTRRLLRTGAFGLVHSHGFTAATQSVLANVGLGCPHVVTLHEVLRANQFPGLKGDLKRRVIGWTLGAADRVITVSQDARANLLEYLPALGSRPDRILTIPHGIDVARLEGAAKSAAPGPTLRERLHLPDATTLIGFFGRFMPEKGLPVLLRAASRLDRGGGSRDFRIVAFGRGDYLREYKAEAAALGIDDRVIFLDFVPNVGTMMRQVDLVVMPSAWEAAGLLAMEAMALGVPLLGSDCIGLREVLGGSPSVMFRSGDPDSLRAALEAAIDRPWTDAAARYAPSARDRFDIRHPAGRLRDVFDQLTARGPRAVT